MTSLPLLKSLTYAAAAQSFLNKYQINANLLQANKFVYVCRQTPFLNFFSQTAEIPAVSVTPVIQTNLYNDIPRIGQKADYNTLNIDFIVDEDLRVYEETYNWLKGDSGPTSSAQLHQQEKKGFYSDIHLLMNTNSETDNLSFVFFDAFPVQLGALTLAHTSKDTYIRSSVVMAYTTFEIRRG